MQGILAVSRALGDYPLKDQGVLSSEPDVLAFKNSSRCISFGIFASDGIWDTLSNEAVMLIATRFLKQYPEDLIGVAKKLCELAIKNNSSDNITIIVVKLSNE